MTNKEAIETVDFVIKNEFFKRCYIGCDLAEALGIVVGLAKKAINNGTISDRPQGKWIDVCTLPCIRKCSICNIEQDGVATVYDNFCPNCGADMRGGLNG